MTKKTKKLDIKVITASAILTGYFLGRALKLLTPSVEEAEPNEIEASAEEEERIDFQEFGLDSLAQIITNRNKIIDIIPKNYDLMKIITYDFATIMNGEETTIITEYDITKDIDKNLIEQAISENNYKKLNANITQEENIPDAYFINSTLTKLIFCDYIYDENKILFGQSMITINEYGKIERVGVEENQAIIDHAYFEIMNSGMSYEEYLYVIENFGFSPNLSRLMTQEEINKFETAAEKNDLSEVTNILVPLSNLKKDSFLLLNTNNNKEKTMIKLK